jgi:hypothetical protein
MYHPDMQIGVIIGAVAALFAVIIIGTIILDRLDR